MASTVPPGRGPLCIDVQALRAWLRSACPSGTKAILPSKVPQNYLSAYEGVSRGVRKAWLVMLKSKNRFDTG